MNLNNNIVAGNEGSGLLPDIWIPVIEVKIGTALFLSRTFWWRNRDGSFFRGEWNEELGNMLELTELFQEQKTRAAAQVFLDLMRPEHQKIFGHSMVVVYCKRTWDILADYSQQGTVNKSSFAEQRLSMVSLFNQNKNTFDPLVETKPM